MPEFNRSLLLLATEQQNSTAADLRSAAIKCVEIIAYPIPAGNQTGNRPGTRFPEQTREEQTLLIESE